MTDQPVVYADEGEPGGVALVKMGEEVYFSADYLAHAAGDWQAGQRRRFQRELEARGYRLAGEVVMRHAPWTGADGVAHLSLRALARYRIHGLFVPPADAEPH